MKKWLRLTLILLVVALLAGAWLWRYITLNRYYDDLDNSGYKLYQAGENVPFEKDGNDKYTDLNGYYVRVDGYEVVDTQEYLRANDIDLNAGEQAEKLVLVTITLTNESCDANPVAVTDFSLRTTDTNLSMNRNLLSPLNEVLGTYDSGVALNAGTQCQLVLPYNLHKSNFSDQNWTHLDEIPLYLQVTNTLITKEIALSD